jgi:hypothetical protein
MRRSLWPLAALALSLALLLAAPPARTESADSLDPRISQLLEQISEERLTAALRRLGEFETRHTLSATDSSTRGIGAAREWIRTELAGYSPKLQVSFDAYQVLKQGERITRDVELRNVMAVLPGRSPRRLYVSGHYDTVARPVKPGEAPSAGGGFDWNVTDNLAPGVNDDGSGTALTMELARVFAQSGVEFDATLVFIAFAGEEEGLVGATLHAERAIEQKWQIDAIFNNDIVGNERGGNGRVDSSSIRVFSDDPSDSRSRQLARHIQRQAARYVPSHQVRLIARADRFGRGGDHTPFSRQGFAAVRFTEARENYARQHTVEDTFEGVSPAYLARNARVNAASLAVLALAPEAPSVSGERGQVRLDRGPSGYDARLRWNASPGAAGYRVFWRDSWTPDWQHERTVPAGSTELVLPDLLIDDHVFGVAALSEQGHESLVSAYTLPERPVNKIQTRAQTE